MLFSFELVKMFYNIKPFETDNLPFSLDLAEILVNIYIEKWRDWINLS